ncbi:aKG-HExxH-type peptide beta-hydroxylase [Halomonas sp. V046]|uniref:aKG-HExxH-type peptide beta-hydroxylase n=1 Tax=Halomonas sp. V046 TaxID=3459611 RepID=UPI00404433CA
MRAHLGADALISLLRHLTIRAGVLVAGQAGDLCLTAFAYRRWLAMRQGAVTTGSDLVTEFVCDPAAERELLSGFIESDSESRADELLAPLTPQGVDEAIAQRDPWHIAAQYAQVVEARDLLWRLLPVQALLNDIVLARIFCAQVPNSLGGSTASRIGVVWINLPLPMAVFEVAELLVHEATHHWTFLDTLVAGPHVRPEANGAMACSSIRHTQRPLVCAFDSLLVAVEPLALRRDLRVALGAMVDQSGIHPSSRALQESAGDCLASITAQSQCLTARGKAILVRSADSLNTHAVPGC